MFPVTAQHQCNKHFPVRAASGNTFLSAPAQAPGLLHLHSGKEGDAHVQIAAASKGKAQGARCKGFTISMGRGQVKRHNPAQGRRLSDFVWLAANALPSATVGMHTYGLLRITALIHRHCA